MVLARYYRNVTSTQICQYVCSESGERCERNRATSANPRVARGRPPYSPKKANRGARHLLTVLTCFLSRKQMQVHTREAIKRKALIPICNCFSISTGLLHRAEVRQHFISNSVENLLVYLSVLFLGVYVCVCVCIRPFPPRFALRFASRISRLSALPSPRARGEPKTRRRAASLPCRFYRKQTITPPLRIGREREESRREPPPRERRFSSRLSHAALARVVAFHACQCTSSCSLMFYPRAKSERAPIPLYAHLTQRPPSSAHRPNFSVLSQLARTHAVPCEILLPGAADLAARRRRRRSSSITRRTGPGRSPAKVFPRSFLYSRLFLRHRADKN